MLSEEFFSSISGPPLKANTAVSKDVGIYNHVLNPSYSVKGSFKKSSTASHGLALTETHIFTAQEQKAQVHVYSRQRGNQECFVSFPERIKCLALAGNVLVLGTVEGRLILWETCSGRQVTTPPCHVQAVTCIATTSHHILSASDDSNINVWSLVGLLDIHAKPEPEPELTLSNHRGGILSLDVSSSSNPESSICVSLSKDKTCIIWNYQSGQLLRTLLLSGTPLCARLDPTCRGLIVASEGGAVSLVEFFGDQPLLGPRSAAVASVMSQVERSLGATDTDAGEISCLAFCYDATSFLTGHTGGKIFRWNLTEGGQPVELASLNASVTNIVFTSPIPGEPLHSLTNVVKPNLTKRPHSLTTQLQSQSRPSRRFHKELRTPGFSREFIEEAVLSFYDSETLHDDRDGSPEVDDMLWNLLNQQRALHKAHLGTGSVAEL